VIVVDTNLIAYLLIGGSHTELAERVYGKDAEWAAPLLWRSELRNVLASYGRSDGLAVDDALLLMRRAEQLLAGREFQPASDHVLAIAWRAGLTAYDAEFVAVARTLALPLVTFDRAILRRQADVAVAPSAFAA
jgi:predicted nucleic acid-binding protein